MKLIRNSFAAGIAFAALTVAACSSQHGATGTGSSSNGGGTDIGSNTGTQGSFGSVGMHLDIGTPPNGATVTQLSWTISNGTNTYTGVNVVGDAQSFEFVQGGILAGTGYTVKLTGTDSNGDPCSGTSSTFTIVAGAVTQTTLAVFCVQPNGDASPADVNTGTVEVDASVTLVPGGSTACPGISSFSISPAEIGPGQPAALTLISTGPAATITWSVTPAGGGAFGSTTAANTTFVCAAPSSPSFVPQVTVTATVALPDSGACTGQTFTTQSALVNCEGTATVVDSGSPPDTGTPPPDTGTPPPDTGTPPPDTGVACNATCDPALDPANCGNGPITGVGAPSCNQTETILFQHSPTCLKCALNAFCLHDGQGDDPTNTGTFDCEDVPGQDTANAAVTNTQTCLNLLSCEVTTACGKAGALDCYCGAGVSSTACKTAQSGLCIPQVTAGLDSTDPNFIELNLTATAKGNGGSVASKIDTCLFQNCQASCF